MKKEEFLKITAIVLTICFVAVAVRFVYELANYKSVRVDDDYRQRIVVNTVLLEKTRRELKKLRSLFEFHVHERAEQNKVVF